MQCLRSCYLYSCLGVMATGCMTAQSRQQKYCSEAVRQERNLPSSLRLCSVSSSLSLGQPCDARHDTWAAFSSLPLWQVDEGDASGRPTARPEVVGCWNNQMWARTSNLKFASNFVRRERRERERLVCGLMCMLPWIVLHRAIYAFRAVSQTLRAKDNMSAPFDKLSRPQQGRLGK